MKKLLFFFGLLALSFNFKSQMWGPATPFASPAGQYQSGIQGGVTKLIEYNNELYASGNFIEAGGLIANCIARWNGSNWNTIYQGDFIQNSVVSDMIVFNNNLYFQSNQLYTWDGTNIDTIQYLDQTTGNLSAIFVSDFCVYNGDLYGSSWLSLFKISTNNVVTYEVLDLPDNAILALEEFNGILYLGGSGGVYKNINGSWISVTGNTVPYIKDLAVFENNLYALGDFNSIGLVTAFNFAKYDGQSWTSEQLSPNTYISNFQLSMPTPNSLNIINNALIFTYPTYGSSGNQPYVFAKQNGNWNVLGSFDPTNSPFGDSFTSCLFQNEIYVGGNFANGPGNQTTIRNLMKIGSSTLNSSNYTEINLNFFPNPTSHSITIKGEINMNQSFQIYDQMGREVFKGKLTETETEVNLSALSKGMYTLKIEGNYQPAQIVKE